MDEKETAEVSIASALSKDDDGCSEDGKAGDTGDFAAAEEKRRAQDFRDRCAAVEDARSRREELLSVQKVAHQAHITNNICVAWVVASSYFECNF